MAQLSPEVILRLGSLAEKARSDIANPPIDYEKHPEQFMELFGPIWSKMTQIIQSVKKNKYTIVRSANGVSKTYTATIIALWWLKVYGPLCKVITTANTQYQMRAVLWNRLRANYNKVRYLFNNADIDITQFYPDPDNWPDWFCLGLSPEIKGEEAPAFQGHQVETGRVLFVFEEAIAISQAVFNAAEGSLRSDNARLLAIFNPTSPEGVVHEWEIDGRCSLEKGNLIEISVYDLFAEPNYKSALSKIEGLQTPTGAQEMIDAYGDDSPIVQARVFGKYPKQDEFAVVTLTGVERAKRRVGQDIGEITRIILPWDVAGEGVDLNVLGRLLVCKTDEVLDEDEEVVWEAVSGLDYRVMDEWHAEHPESEERVWDWIMKTKEEFWTEDKHPIIELIPDATGEGSHYPAYMRNRVVVFGEDSAKIKARPFKGGAAAGTVKEYPELEILNRISEAWYLTGLVINKDQWSPLVADLDNTTKHQLTTRKFFHQAKRKVPLVWFVEPKDDWKKRNRGRSPDHADAFVMGIWAYRHPPKQIHLAIF